MKSSNYFFYNEDKMSLNSRLSLDDEIVSAAREITHELLEYIKPKIKEMLGYEVKHYFQGSYKNFTLIRPPDKFKEFDIDVGIYLFFDLNKENQKAKNIRNKIRDILIEFQHKNKNIKSIISKDKCERVIFDKLFHVDIPIYSFSSKEECSLATLENNWIDSDPKSLQDWFQNKLNKMNPSQKLQIRRIIRYLKSFVSLNWREVEESTIPSIAITVLVANHYEEDGDDEKTFIKTFKNINKELDSKFEIKSPINNDNLLNLDRVKIVIAKDKFDTLEKLCDYVMASDNIFEKYQAWSTVFKYMFPSFLGCIFNADEEKDNLPALTKPPFIKVKHFTKNKIYLNESVNKRIISFKDELLDFSIDNKHEYPFGSEVFWQVRNEGKESGLLNDLGHYFKYSIDMDIREVAMYEGIHFIDCTVFYNNDVLGVNSLKVKVNSLCRPERNPKKKKYGIK